MSAFPVSGGAWVYSSRLGSPLIGFLVLASIILHIMSALALLAIGFGRYFEVFIPGSALFMGAIILLVFLVINLLGVKFAGWVQIVLAICGDFLVIIIFIIFGFPNIELKRLLDPQGGLFPTGFIGIFTGAVILSFSYAGFQAIIEIGGEIKNPRKNIPLGLIISFFLIAVVYILVSIVMTGTMDWRELGRIEGTLIDVAANFLPMWFLSFLNILILIAIASTIHGVLLAYSRDLFSAARDKIVPDFLSKINKKYNTPHWSLIFFIIGSIILLIFQASIIDLSFMSSLTIAIAGVVIAYIPVTLEKKYPELVKNSNFKLKRKVLLGLVGFNVIYSILSIMLMVAVSPSVVFSATIFYLLAIIYYILRKRWLKKKGLNLDEICKKIPEEALEV